MQVIGFHTRYVVDAEGILSERDACMNITVHGMFLEAFSAQQGN